MLLFDGGKKMSLEKGWHDDLTVDVRNFAQSRTVMWVSVWRIESKSSRSRNAFG
jgi:hypothetical protein